MIGRLRVLMMQIARSPTQLCSLAFFAHGEVTVGSVANGMRRRSTNIRYSFTVVRRNSIPVMSGRGHRNRVAVGQIVGSGGGGSSLCTPAFAIIRVMVVFADSLARLWPVRYGGRKACYTHERGVRDSKELCGLRPT